MNIYATNNRNQLYKAKSSKKSSKDAKKNYKLIISSFNIHSQYITDKVNKISTDVKDLNNIHNHADFMDNVIS